ncbi:hypothetical protein G7K_1435-t1 [Saitoella complicata NRRL Y-17804]|uniref:Uncharacterized protein n=1 Tax=Saitoella complicata (strain BCRC 22490 / CBS 7301 / JCM 7358 / NBRC 10748 / NRRL Y-17804) TaxID=698492 RepID=A0A0E9NCT2_SAICN|nr:hypothetical protein G7K_1435-t1 [Saitoella complicata NRRL Y-17804]
MGDELESSAMERGWIYWALILWMISEPSFAPVLQQLAMAMGCLKSHSSMFAFELVCRVTNDCHPQRSPHAIGFISDS